MSEKQGLFVWLRQKFGRSTPATSSAARQLLTQLEAAHKNTDIDWEAVLESDYLVLLADRNDLGIIDIGGHAGRHSRVFLEKLKPSNLMIFEPLPEKRNLLIEMFSSNKNVDIREFALGNRRGESTFIIKTTAPEESGLKQRSFYNDGTNENLEKITVKVETLDAMDVPFTVNFIKIDTEGGEMDILEGGLNLLRRDSPIISVEYGPGGYDAYGYTSDALFNFASKVGYSVFDLFGNKFTSIEDWKSCVSRFYWDYLLIPNSLIDKMSGRIDVMRVAALKLLPPPRGESRSSEGEHSA
ncbi:FkbM family methyltransferase [Humitalea sp. 24SJ18S-53]|uniref:FkbM family methyltransferase n=1 Tax=Humitalea sp. 24SJ18S-53 TaxID=3422307 RepID=UPI003D66A38D